MSADIGEEIDGCFVFKTKIHQHIIDGALESDEICTLKIRTEHGKICIL